MIPDEAPRAGRSGVEMWELARAEIREVVWLASVIGALSAAGVALGLAMAAG
jgi:hypothetical protein